jgi:hypothetical protein
MKKITPATPDTMASLTAGGSPIANMIAPTSNMMPQHLEDKSSRFCGGFGHGFNLLSVVVLLLSMLEIGIYFHKL